MKKSKTILRLFVLIILTVSASYAQQTFIHTVTSSNGATNGSRDCNDTCSKFDIPASFDPIKDNPAAILFITQIGGASNPHPIGARYMYLNKWSVFNLDAQVIPVGAQFKVEYYSPDANHFVYSLPPRVNASDPAYIDNAGLNNNPNAQIRVFPHISQTIGNSWNKEEVKVEYDKATARWFIANLNATPITPLVAYNVMFSNAIVFSNPNTGKDLNNTNVKTPIAGGNCTCVIPTSLPPNGNASGDLSGTYPNPTVVGLQNRPLSNVAPTIGQILKWNGSAWEPVNENVPTPPAIAPKPSVVFFTQSKDVLITDPNIDSATIDGLNNQTFTLTQSSHVVFHATISVNYWSPSLVGEDTSFVPVRFEVVISNSAGTPIGRAVAQAVLAVRSADYRLVAVGGTTLPAGTYHTKVTINRPLGGLQIDTVVRQNEQAGQLIVEIFPD